MACWCGRVACWCGRMACWWSPCFVLHCDGHCVSSAEVGNVVICFLLCVCDLPIQSGRLSL